MADAKGEKADGEVTVYAAVALSSIHSSRSDCAGCARGFDIATNHIQGVVTWIALDLAEWRSSARRNRSEQLQQLTLGHS